MPFMIPIVVAAAPYIAAAGAVVSAYGAYDQGQKAKKAGEYNAKIQEQNAGIARSDAAANAAQTNRENTLRIGAIRANMGAGGGTEGSALDVLGDITAQGKLQSQFQTYGGEMQARGYGNSASLDRYEGGQAARAGTLKASGELLSGAGYAGGLYNARNQPARLNYAGSK